MIIVFSLDSNFNPSLRRVLRLAGDLEHKGMSTSILSLGVSPSLKALRNVCSGLDFRLAPVSGESPGLATFP